HERLIKRMENLEKAVTLQNEKENLKAMKGQLAAYDAGFNKVVKMINEGKVKGTQQANTILDEVKDQIHKLENNSKDIADGAEKRMSLQEGLMLSTKSRVTLIVVILALISLLVGIGIALLITRSIKHPVRELLGATEQLALGDVSVEVKITTKDEIGQLAQSFKTMVENIKESALGAEKISQGDLNFEVKAKSDKDVLSMSVTNVIQTLRGLISEIALLSTAAVEGKLAVRGNAEKFKGGFGEIVQGINNTLDAVIGPLNVSAEYLDRISKGDIPPRITDSYNGDFNEIKNNLNQCIEAVKALVSDANVLSRAAVEGKLTTRADAAKHQGDFRKIVEGV
ncbi:MAG: hypothetical protein C0407_19540, partial [Desulfobacca sp.]|nr:hypothetical protein [Desulfobacca sp.]